jgi:hypothetical protein
MGIPSVGGGRQVGDGNVNEVVLSVQAAPQTATVTATLTVAQITGALIVATPATGTPAAYTLPTVNTALTGVDAILVNAKINSSFDFAVINLGDASSVITMTAAAGTGWTLVGSGAIPIAATGISGSANFRARKTAVGAWTIYRLS